MNDTTLDSLIVLRSLTADGVFSALAGLCRRGGDEALALFAGEVIAAGAERDLLGYAAERILCDENAFSVCCARGRQPSAQLKRAFMHDVNAIFGCINMHKSEFSQYVETGSLPAVFSDGDDRMADRLCKFYAENGYGKFIRNCAFSYEDGKLVPIGNPAAVTLDELKGYADEKRAIDANIVSFLRGLPYSNMLLYGDRGTGKSSTVHAMLNKYRGSGLRLVEINRENMLELPRIRQQLMENPLKFIIFIDDLSLNEGDEKISGLKAALEGSVSGRTDNTMIVATSNRRHIVKENFSDRENSVHVNDSMQEQLSLSDRFGITVLFSSTDKRTYLDIVSQLALDCGLKADEKLLALAERWALVKGGRSPRRAKQFTDLMLSCKMLGTEPQF